ASSPLSPAPLHQTLRPSPSLRLPVRHLPVASSAAPSGAAASATECPRFLERCGLNADEFDDDAEAEPTVGLFGRSIRGLAEVNFTAVAGGLSVFLFVCFQGERRGRPSSWLDLVSPCSAVAATSSPLSWPPHPPPKKSPTAGFIDDGDDVQ
ncbi:Os03g0745400, partial [Oryza sativa Japonica Group]